MGTQEKRFIAKNSINMEEVMYMIKEGRKSAIYFSNGRIVTTFNPIKGMIEDYPEGMFEAVNKGIVINPNYLKKVENNIYTMVDGRTFNGRVRNPKKKQNMVEKTENVECRNGYKEFAMLNSFPVAFCIIEMVFDEFGHGIDFIFRYCNDEMENFENKKIEDMIGKSFYEIFENGDKKWLVTYADVALNGCNRIIESYSPEIDANIRIYCSQPKPNHCACAMVKI